MPQLNTFTSESDSAPPYGPDGGAVPMPSSLCAVCPGEPGGGGSKVQASESAPTRLLAHRMPPHFTGFSTSRILRNYQAGPLMETGRAALDSRSQDCLRHRHSGGGSSSVRCRSALLGEARNVQERAGLCWRDPGPCRPLGRWSLVLQLCLAGDIRRPYDHQASTGIGADSHDFPC